MNELNNYAAPYTQGLEKPITEIDWARRQLQMGAAIAQFCTEIELTPKATSELILSVLSGVQSNSLELIIFFEQCSELFSHNSREQFPVARIPEALSLDLQQIDPTVPYASELADGMLPAAAPKSSQPEQSGSLKAEETPDIGAAIDFFTLPSTLLELKRLKRDISAIEHGPRKNTEVKDDVIRKIIAIDRQVRVDPAGVAPELRRSYKALEDICFRSLVACMKPSMAAIIKKRAKAPQDADELWSHAQTELLRCMRVFDLSHEGKFIIYATVCVEGTIKRFYRDKSLQQSLLSRTLWEKTNKLERLREAGLSWDKITDETGITQSKAEKLFVETEHRGRFVSLDTPVGASDPESLTLGELIPHTANEPLSMLLSSVIDERLSHVLERLSFSHRELAVLEGRFGICRTGSGQYVYDTQDIYFRPYPQASIGEKLGISQMQVSRLEQRIVDKLQRILVLPDQDSELGEEESQTNIGS